MSDEIKVTWRGQEVRNPLGRAVIITACIIALPFALLLAIACIAVALPIFAVIILLSLPLHYGLRLGGRRGFMKDDRREYSIDRDGFRRASR